MNSLRAKAVGWKRTKADKFLGDRKFENTAAAIADAVQELLDDQQIEYYELELRRYVKNKWWQRHRLLADIHREKPPVGATTIIDYAYKYITSPVYDLHLGWMRSQN